MYNRYIPQSDGSFKRQKCHESPPHPKRENKPSHPPKPDPPKDCTPPCPVPAELDPPCPAQAPMKKCNKQESCRQSDGSVMGFLHNLLPKDFDTGDLLIILLLLLMSGDCAEDQNTAL